MNIDICARFHLRAVWPCRVEDEICDGDYDVLMSFVWRPYVTHSATTEVPVLIGSSLSLTLILNK